MAKGVAIVAIPEEGDRVWKVSSEKVPHMTLLFLGDVTDEEALSRMETYLEFVTRTSMNRFGMDVDRRGTLGPKDADVLFFTKHNVKMLELLRYYLLKNPDISTAHQSAPQFPEFIPHLTLGFPTSPAHKDTGEFPIHWVSFDRIALWTGDFEGPEFVIPRKEWDWEGELAMNGATTANEILSHHGVKGMRWGVRRSKRELARASRKSARDAFKSSEDAKTARAHRAKVKKGGVKALTNKELQELITRQNLEQQYSRMNPHWAAKGSKVAAEILVGVGKQHATKLISDAVGNQIQRNRKS